jgi:hypothetical protein
MARKLIPYSRFSGKRPEAGDSRQRLPGACNQQAMRKEVAQDHLQATLQAPRSPRMDPGPGYRLHLRDSLFYNKNTPIGWALRRQL